MTTIRQQTRISRATRNQRAADKGVSLDNLKKENRSTQALAKDITMLTNESIPRLGSRQRLIQEDPPAGAFDGVNKDYTLSEKVLFNDLKVGHMKASGPSYTRLDRTSSTAPAAGQFYFDGVSLIRVGEAPQPTDNLVVTYATER